MRTLARYNRPVDIGPCRYVDRGHVVGAASVAPNTLESATERPISLAHTTADRAHPGWVPWIDGLDGDSRVTFIHCSRVSTTLPLFPERMISMPFLKSLKGI